MTRHLPQVVARHVLSAVAALVLVSGLASGTGLAQSDPSDALLDAFVSAFIEVRAIRVEAEQQIAEAQTQEDRESLMQDATQQMASAVEQTEGITIAQYNDVIAQAQEDQALADRINGMLQERVESAQ